MASPTHEEIENEGNGLASNVLGLFESSIMGIAGFSTLELRCLA